MRTIIISCIWIAVTALQVSNVMSFTTLLSRRAAQILAPRLGWRSASSSSSSIRWMTTQDAPVEKTEEEKAVIKAEREARK
jgi:hypothetical protein